jgi:hypothetical protein
MEVFKEVALNGVLPSLARMRRSGGGRGGHDLYCEGSCKEHAVSPGLAGAAQLLATVNTSCWDI